VVGQFSSLHDSFMIGHGCWFRSLGVQSMKRIRFNIASLLVIIFILGVGFAALRESSDLWDSGVFTSTIGLLLTSILLAVHRTESRRAFWIGFALFGAAYLGLSVVPSIESRSITTKALAYLDSKLPGRPTVPPRYITSLIAYRAVNNQVSNVNVALDGIQSATTGQGPARRWNVATGRLLGGWSGTTENFVRIGHSLFALLAAWLGGQLSRRLCRSSRLPEPTSAIQA
jgi:hypothetical protein